MAKLAFLGTGLIGSGMIRALIAAGHQLRIYNRTRAKAEALAGSQVSVADGPAAALVGAERVHLALSDDGAVDALLDAAGIYAAPTADGLTIVDHTTTQPAATLARAARLRERGHHYLHAPVFMSPAMCEQAKGIMLIAGSRECYTRLQPALGAMTGQLMYLGERADLAAAYKLFGNAMIIGITGALADVFTLATELGVEPQAAHALFSTFNPAATVAGRGAKMAVGNYTPSFELSMARKDVRLMLESAGAAPLCVLPGIAQRMDRLIEQGHSQLDLAALSITSIPAQTQRE